MEGAIFTSDVLPGEERKLEVMLKTPLGRRGVQLRVVYFPVAIRRFEEVDRSILYTPDHHHP